MSVEIKVEFERQCHKCYGRAAWSKDENCAACGNTGYVPTQLGRELLEFLEHHGINPPTTTKEGRGSDEQS